MSDLSFMIKYCNFLTILHD